MVHDEKQSASKQWFATKGQNQLEIYGCFPMVVMQEQQEQPLISGRGRGWFFGRMWYVNLGDLQTHIIHGTMAAPKDGGTMMNKLMI